MSTTSYDWLSKIEEGVHSFLEIPLWGNAPSFPLPQFSEKIKDLLEGQKVSIRIANVQWLSRDKLSDGMGQNPKVVSIDVAPINTPVYWAMANEDITKFTSLAISSTETTLSSEALQEGFYQYCILEALAILDDLMPYQGIRCRISESNFQGQGAFCIDVSLTTGPHKLFGRLFFSEEFLSRWKKHFAHASVNIFEKDGWEDLNLMLRCEIGSTTLSQQEWKSVHPGDFITLDRCLFDPVNHKGNVTIFLEDTAIFQGRLKNDHIKIVDYALYQEKELSMDDEFEESNLPEEHEEHAENPESEQKLRHLIATKDASLPIHIEIAEIHMNLKKLVELKPGNLVELNIRPEDGVYLTLHGKRIARAELVKLGEVLGVKILEMKQS